MASVNSFLSFAASTDSCASASGAGVPVLRVSIRVSNSVQSSFRKEDNLDGDGSGPECVA